MGTEETVAQHYTHGALERTVLDALRGAGKDPDRLEPGDLAPVDEFHIGGRQATVDFAAELRVTRGMHLLDIGSGLGGASRYFAHVLGCTVTGIDLTEEYVRVAQALSERTGLAGQGLVPARQRARPALPRWYLRRRLHAPRRDEHRRQSRSVRQVRQVLKPRGVFGVYDVMREGEGARLPGAVGRELGDELRRIERYLRPATGRRGLRGARPAQPPRVRDHVLPGTARAHHAERRAAPRAASPHGCDDPQKIANMVSVIEAGLISPTEIICRAGG